MRRSEPGRPSLRPSWLASTAPELRHGGLDAHRRAERHRGQDGEHDRDGVEPRHGAPAQRVGLHSVDGMARARALRQPGPRPVIDVELTQRARKIRKKDVCSGSITRRSAAKPRDARCASTTKAWTPTTASPVATPMAAARNTIRNEPVGLRMLGTVVSRDSACTYAELSGAFATLTRRAGKPSPDATLQDPFATPRNPSQPLRNPRGLR